MNNQMKERNTWKMNCSKMNMLYKNRRKMPTILMLVKKIQNIFYEVTEQINCNEWQNLVPQEEGPNDEENNILQYMEENISWAWDDHILRVYTSEEVEACEEELVNTSCNESNEINENEIPDSESVIPISTQADEGLHDIAEEPELCRTDRHLKSPDLPDLSDIEESDAESEYKSSSEETDEEQADDRVHESGKKLQTTNEQEETNVNIDQTNTLNNSALLRNIEGHSAPDDEEIIVETIAEGGKKIKHYCKFCQKPFSRISRHLKRVHSDEPTVQTIKVLDSKDPKRRELFDILRRAGDHIHNNTKLPNGEKVKLVVPRRAKSASTKPEDYLVCSKCLAYRKGVNMRHHYSLCTDGEGAGERSLGKLSRTIMGQINPLANRRLRQDVFPVLRVDDPVRAIRYDVVAISYGNLLCDKYKESPHYDNMIRSRLRFVGRFLVELKKLSTVTDLKSAFNPIHLDHAIAAINTLAGLTEDGRRYTKFSCAQALGGLVKAVGHHLRDMYSKENNNEKIEEIDRYLLIFDE